jgi:hypothetical protein
MNRILEQIKEGKFGKAKLEEYNAMIRLVEGNKMRIVPGFIFDKAILIGQPVSSHR